MNCNWQSIQKKLTTKDIAIEFLKCPLGLYNDSVLYIALALKKGYDSPLLIPLCNELVEDIQCLTFFFKVVINSFFKFDKYLVIFFLLSKSFFSS